MSQRLEGRVVNFNAEKMIAQIEASGVRYQADKKVIEESGFQSLSLGDVVYFKAETRKGKQARITKLFRENPTNKLQFETLQEPSDYRTGANDFSNPYNF